MAFLFVAAVGLVGVDGTCEGVAPDVVDEDLLFFHLILPTDFFAFFGIVSTPSYLGSLVIQRLCLLLKTKNGVVVRVCVSACVAMIIDHSDTTDDLFTIVY